MLGKSVTSRLPAQSRLRSIPTHPCTICQILFLNNNVFSLACEHLCIRFASGQSSIFAVSSFSPTYHRPILYHILGQSSKYDEKTRGPLSSPKYRSLDIGMHCLPRMIQMLVKPSQNYIPGTSLVIELHDIQVLFLVLPQAFLQHKLDIARNSLIVRVKDYRRPPWEGT